MRVKTRAVITPSDEGGTIYLFAITVENHSPRKFYLASVGLKLADGRGLWFKQDALSKKPNAPQVIEPGDAYSFYASSDTLTEVAVENIVCAEAYDKIGRIFNSDAEETKQALEAVMKSRRRPKGRG